MAWRWWARRAAATTRATTRHSATTAASTATTAASSGAATTAAGGATNAAVKIPTGAKCSGIALAFFGAYTGPNAGLGIPIYNGEKLAIDQFNAQNPNCQVGLKKFDSQGSPDQAPQLARSVVGDASVVGVVGPAFSGESKNANPIFNEAGLPIITPSATNATLQQQGWTIFHRLLANDDTQGPGVAKYITTTLNAEKVYVIDDASDYGKGLAQTRQRRARPARSSGQDEIDPKATDYSATVTKVKAASPDAVFYGGYYSQAGPLAKQLKDGGVKATFVSGDGTKDAGFVKLGGDATEGAILSCTSRAVPAGLRLGLQGGVQHGSEHVRPRGLRLGVGVPERHRRRQGHPRRHQHLPQDHRRPGRDQGDQVRRPGRGDLEERRTSTR